MEVLKGRNRKGYTKKAAIVFTLFFGIFLLGSMDIQPFREIILSVQASIDDEEPEPTPIQKGCDYCCEEDIVAVCDLEGDCDGDGWENNEECSMGFDPCDWWSAPRCEYFCESGDDAICVYALGCDFDGFPNSYECWAGTDPCDENDYPWCDFLCENDAVMICNLPGDCDGDRYDNYDECELGTNPCDPNSNLDVLCQGELGAVQEAYDLFKAKYDNYCEELVIYKEMHECWMEMLDAPNVSDFIAQN